MDEYEDFDNPVDPDGFRASAPAPSAARTPSWNQANDVTLWNLYRNGSIDPNNNDRDYLLRCSQQYFPELSRNAATAIRRLRDKNKRRRLEIQLEGQRRAAAGEYAGEYHSYRVFCCLIVLYSPCLAFTDEEEEKQEDPEGDMSRNRGGAARPDPATDVNQLSRAMSNAAVSTAYKPYSLAVTFPYLIWSTHFDDQGRRKCMVDILVFSQHQNSFLADLDEAGTTVTLKVKLPESFITSNRLEDEIVHVGDRDALYASHHEATNLIAQNHGTDIVYSEEQKIKLPFACDLDFEKYIVWNTGDTLLFNELAENPDIGLAHHQMMPVLRIELNSVKKRLNRGFGASRISGRTPPRMGGGGGGAAGGAGAGGGDRGGGRGGGGGGGGGGDSVVTDTTMSSNGEDADDADSSFHPVSDETSPDNQTSAPSPAMSYRSTGGPSSFVPNGLLAEAMRREARAAQRRQWARQQEEHRANENQDLGEGKEEEDDVSL